jgi:hypothetical protein
MVYKGLWSELTAMLKDMKHYQPRKTSASCPQPLPVNPVALNNARLFARKNMILIAKETSALALNPEIADLDRHGNIRAMPHQPPSLLASCMPVRIDTKEERESHYGSAECAALGRLLRLDNVYVHPLSGDKPEADCATERGLHRTFSTVHASERGLDLPTSIRFHGHKHRTTDYWTELAKHSRSSHMYLSGIGISTAKDANTPACKDGMHKHVGKTIEDDERFWSKMVDTMAGSVLRTVVEFRPGTNKISSIALLDRGGSELTSWRQYGYGRMARPVGLRTEVQEPPDKQGWALMGFWGHCDAIVITQIGTLWKRT